MRPAILLLVLVLALPAAASAQNEAANDALIRNALSAAPSSVAEHATVARFDGTVLREGSNGWVCMPDLPEVANNSPMCLDANWREIIDALQNRRAPTYTGVAFSYMLKSDMPVSNTDPYATAATPDNEWIETGVPHIMVAISDPAMLEGISTDPDNGGPWVMWKGTPYAHVMIPTEPRAD